MGDHRKKGKRHETTLNEVKTGGATPSGSLNLDQETSLSNRHSLGEGLWDFLKLGSFEKWTIDDHEVEIHTRELQEQLKACRSVLTWVEAWNIYVAGFVSNNFEIPRSALSALIWIW